MSSVERKSLRTVGNIFLIDAICGGVVIAVRWNMPLLRILSAGHQVKIDVSTLGEYPTTLKRVRLSEVNGETVVWELIGEDEAQTHGFVLSEGENPVQIESDHGHFRLSAPMNSPHFTLRSGVSYKLELWGSGNAFNKNSAIIRVGK